ncbi:hypothetical protein BV22DRAFT_1039940 [Leucogyrophana mollusca]|uniref:Uncharacterized protein n=1 Tax=Leucogyrophana mollusca TaxID=85980 RepID=A0ACB8B3T3_9AGAM|nr:hypothetical protein BV22DRAFT_1039940 [Leucogyrophana mollusca]
MLEADSAADYFPFDPSGEPVRVAIRDYMTKAMFRVGRVSAMSGAEQMESEWIAQCLIKKMDTRPGLSRETGDAGEKLEKLEAKLDPEGVILERMAKGMTSMTPRLMDLMRKR